jgi:nucleoid DNA-binding protein
VTRETLSYVVGEYLGLPRLRRHGKAYTIVNTIITVVTEALQRGEKVSIEGVGTFKVRTRPPTHSTCSDFSGTTPLNHYLTTLPQKSYVHFTPSKTILRTLNADRDQHPV